MASLFGALGSLAESYGLARKDVISERQQEARTRQEEERVKLEEEQIRQEGVRTQLEQARLKQELKSASRPMFLGSPYTRGGKQFQRYWDPDATNAQGGQGKLAEMELGAEESALQKFVREYTEVYGHPPTEEVAGEAVYKIKPTTATPSNYEAEARQWHYFGIKPPAKDAAEVDKVMQSHRWGPGRALTGMEGRTLETAKEAEDFTKDLIKFIEDNKLTTSNNWAEGENSVLQRRAIAWAYLHGHAPSDVLSGQQIRMAAAIRILGAQPYMQAGRGLALFREIGKHLPDLGDTPANMYQKAIQLITIYDAIKRDVSTVGAEGFDPEAGAFGVSGGGGGATPSGATPSPAPTSPVTIPPPAGSRNPRVVIHPDGSIEVQ